MLRRWTALTQRRGDSQETTSECVCVCDVTRTFVVPHRNVILHVHVCTGVHAERERVREDAWYGRGRGKVGAGLWI